MKTMMKTISIALFLVSIQGIVMAQSIESNTMFLQKCIDLTELQSYYKTDNRGNVDQLYIMQFPTTFSTDLKVSKSGRQAIFMSKEEISKNEVSSYFAFRTYEITGDKANATFNYFYDYDYKNAQFKMLIVNVDMTIQDSQCVVSNINLKGDTK